MSEGSQPTPKADLASAGHHGGDIWGASRALDRPVKGILDLSASLNPSGPPQGLAEVLLQSFDLICHYPDRSSFELRRALAGWLGLEPGCILPGNGSTALIQLITRALHPKKTVVFSPAFGEFFRALEQSAWNYTPLHMAESQAFTPQTADLQTAWSLNPDCLIITNPISPSGALIPLETLEEAFEQVKRRQAWLILDEAFIDFADREARSWSAPRIMQYPRMIVLRSLTKFYCLAGLRLGFLMTHPQTMRDLEPLGEPWGVNTLAQAAGAFCIKHEGYAEQSRELINHWRGQMAQRLESLGMEIYPSQVNYLLMRMPQNGPSAGELAQTCFQEGVLLRDCSSFEGCTKRHLRIAVCKPAEQERLFALLEDKLAQF